ncbi:MAG: extracellular solute-binding protein family 5, partial [Bacteroidota bacterium]|nr:extracellular solute-binding protein family 5 [Bacteroidota bacterium]
DLKVELRDKFNLLKTSYLNTEYLGFKIQYKSEKTNPWQDKRIRKAVNYGFNRKEMIKYLRKGVGRPAESGFTPYGLPSFDEEKVKGFTYDPAKAKQLLKEAGFANGEGLPAIKLYTNETYKEYALYISKQLEQLGVKIKVEISQPAILREWMSQGKADFFRGSWLADYPDAENYFAVFYSKNGSPPNYTRFNNKQFDELYEKALAENDDTKRYEIYHQMEQIIIDEAPVVPLFYDEVLRFSQKNVEGLTPNALNLLNLKRVKIK